MFGLDSKLHIAGYGLALAIIAYLIFNPRVKEVPIEYEEDESMRDTTTVVKTVTDTVMVYDTTEVQLDIPEPQQEDSVNTYTTNYSDSFINAEITSEVKGQLLDQRLWYVRRVEHIFTDSVRTVYVDRYFKPVKAFTDPYEDNPKGVWGGVQAQNLGENINFTPNVMFVRGNVAYEVGYNLNEESLKNFDFKAVQVGVKFKIF